MERGRKKVIKGMMVCTARASPESDLLNKDIPVIEFVICKVPFFQLI